MSSDSRVVLSGRFLGGGSDGESKVEAGRLGQGSGACAWLFVTSSAILCQQLSCRTLLSSQRWGFLVDQAGSVTSRVQRMSDNRSLASDLEDGGKQREGRH